MIGKLEILNADKATLISTDLKCREAQLEQEDEWIHELWCARNGKKCAHSLKDWCYGIAFDLDPEWGGSPPEVLFYDDEKVDDYTLQGLFATETLAKGDQDWLRKEDLIIKTHAWNSEHDRENLKYDPFYFEFKFTPIAKK